MKKTSENKKFRQLITLFMVLCCVLMFKSVPVEASMADEAYDYTLGETYRGKHTGTRYYKFSISQSSHVTLNVELEDGNYTFFKIYNEKGKVMLLKDNIRLTKNAVTGMWTGRGYRTLPKGVYYFSMCVNNGDPYNSKEYFFNIEADNVITLAKGQIASAVSKKLGQMTVTCKPTKNALGYRIQYSTDYRFRTGVKTIYSTSRIRTITKLAKGRTYYVRVQPFNVYTDGEYVFGLCSYIKAVWIKK